MSRALTFLAAAVLALPLFSAAHAGEVAKPAIKIENPGTQCVAPADEMRRNHMEMLKHQRDRTLRLGERGAKVTLNGCIECHASKTNGAVTGGKDNFCEACHAYAAVKLDCFDCHQPKAGYKAAAATKPSGEHE
ncbi:MAG TPA: hypothetical protein VF816_02390 [Rhodocyclaceae bacterium]